MVLYPQMDAWRRRILVPPRRTLLPFPRITRPPTSADSAPSDGPTTTTVLQRRRCSPSSGNPPSRSLSSLAPSGRLLNLPYQIARSLSPHAVQTLPQLTLWLTSVSDALVPCQTRLLGQTNSTHVSTTYRLRISTPIQRSLSNTRLPLQTSSLSFFFFHRTPKPKICRTTSCTTATQHRALRVQVSSH